MLVQGGEKSMKLLLLLLGDGGFAMANVCRDGVWWWWRGGDLSRGGQTGSGVEAAKEWTDCGS
jgi:hypothetical protein